MERSSATPRVVRVFVSSTFRDMGAERDELVKRTFPALRKLCESRGVTWGEVDLRWGITDEQKAEGQVLPICLAEIARSRPYFIGLLGERYGWVPDAIEPAAIETEPWLAELAGRSVTELEILHGVLNNPQMASHTFFYLRDPAYVEGKPASQYRESEHEPQAKLAALKDRIRASGLPVHEDYPDPRILGELVLADLSAVIESLFPADSEPDPLAREAAEHEAFARSRAGVYIGRAEYFDRLDDNAAGDGAPLVVTGESGSGKSALLANWATRYRAAHPDELVQMHFIGASAASSEWASMLRELIGELKARFSLTIEIPDAPDALRLAFANALHMVATRGRVVLVIDALNQLEDREGALDLAWLPPAIPDNVRLVASTLPGRPLDEATKRGWPTLAVAPLEPEERERLIVDYLATYSRALSAALRQRIAASAQCSNPLYLRAMLDELRVWGEHETLPDRIDHYLAASSVDALYELILARYEADYERDRPKLVRDAFSLLWAARRGLSETELLDLLGTDGQPLARAYWSPLFLAAEQSLTSRSGLLNFFHDYLRSAVEHRYLPDQQPKQEAHLRIGDYFAAREIGPRQIDELPWQLAQAQAWQRLTDLLADLEFLESAWGANQLEVRAYWAAVEAGSDLRMTDAYRLVLKSDAKRTTGQVFSLANLLYKTGHPEQALPLQEHLVRTFRALGDLASLQAPLGNQALILHEQGDLDGAMARMKEQEQIGRQLGDLAIVHVALGNQALILQDRGDPDGAMSLLEEKERICRELGDEQGLQGSLVNQAVILQDRGDLDGAMSLLGEQERICRRLGDPASLALSLDNQAMVLRARGDLDSAMGLMKESEQICRELGNRTGLQATIGNEAILLHGRGDLDGALALLKEQEQICRDLGNLKGLATAIVNQAGVLGQMGRPGEGVPLADEAFRLASEHRMTALAQQVRQLLEHLHSDEMQIGRESGDLRRRLLSLGSQAETLFRQGDFASAIALHKEAERICRQLGDPEDLATSLANQAIAYSLMGRRREALARAEEAQEIAKNGGLSSLAQQIRQIADSLR